MSDNNLSIFEGQPALPEWLVREISCIWKRVGGDAQVIIDTMGSVYHEKGNWERPLSDKTFKALKEAFAGHKNPAVEVWKDGIWFDFHNLQYNRDFVMKLIRERGWGVRISDDDKDCMDFYVPLGVQGETHYLKSEGRFRLRCKLSELGEFESRVCAVSANMGNPSTADWNTLYFPAAA